MCVCVYLVAWLLNKLSTKFSELSEGEECVTGKSWLDFDGDSEHSADTGIPKQNF